MYPLQQPPNYRQSTSDDHKCNSPGRYKASIKYLGCDIRRTDPSSLDFAVGVYEDAHPYVGLGNLATENWSLENLDLDDFANEDELIERLIGLLRDWLEGRMQVVTEYAGNVPCHWIVTCGDEILAESRRFIYPYWAKKRTVVQHS